MPADSKKQQRFMGMVYAYKLGKLPNASAEVTKAAESISLQDAKDFAHSQVDEANQPQGTHPFYGKAPKRGTLGYEIWKSKVAAEKKEKDYTPGDEKVGNATVLRDAVSESTAYNVGDKVTVHIGGKKIPGIITKPPHKKTGNYGVRFKNNKTTINTVASPDELTPLTESGGASVAFEMGRKHGMASQKPINAEKSYGVFSKDYYNGYAAGKSAREDSDLWHEKQQSGRRATYHEGVGCNTDNQENGMELLKELCTVITEAKKKKGGKVSKTVAASVYHRDYLKSRNREYREYDPDTRRLQKSSD